MEVDVILGLQWGDEGKGKIVDVLSKEYDIIARFQGGPNAGHSLEFNNIKHILHLIPSGIFHENKINLIGNGVVLDPIIFRDEVTKLQEMGVDVEKRLYLSQKTHLILPTHKILDAASEAAKGKSKIGSTLKGIGPTYMDKTGRNGLRIGDILSPEFKTKYNKLIGKHKQLLQIYDFEYDINDFQDEWFEGIELIKKFNLIDSEYFINEQLNSGKKILAEGAQGTMLDIDFGSYPYVTSSNTISAGVCTGLGISPKKIGDVFGIFKAYCTRVGSGPFPTELHDENGKCLQEQGHEFGATTGRPRRCGWLDLIILKYAIMINGVTKLIMTKADVLDCFDAIQVANEYREGDKSHCQLPYDIECDLHPVYKEFKGWSEKLSGLRSYQQLPSEFLSYITYIEKETGIDIEYISVGPNRNAIIKK